MKTFMALLVFVAFLIPHFSIAVVLDAPGEKKVTVGSEIKRGYAAVDPFLKSFDFYNNYESLDLLFKVNRQNNIDSKGFLLGASLNAWAILSIKMEVLKGKVSQEDYDFGRKMAVDYFKKFRALQTELQLSDEQMLEAAVGKKSPGAKGGPGTIDWKIREWDFILKKGEDPS